MLLNPLEQTFEEICRTLISILVSSGQRQFKCTTGECNGERKSSEEFRLPCCRVNSDPWAHRPCLNRDADSSHWHRTKAPALPCPRNWESSAAHSQVHAWESATGGLRQAKLVSQNCLYHHSFPNLPIFHWPSYLRHLPTEGRTHCQQEGKWKILQPRHFPDSEVIPVALQLFRKTMIGQAVQRNRLLVLN